MNIDLDDLADKAKKVTPGPWELRSSKTYEDGHGRYEGYEVIAPNQGDTFNVVTDCSNATVAVIHDEGGFRWDAQGEANMAYFAALDPTTVLTLIDMARRAALPSEQTETEPLQKMQELPLDAKALEAAKEALYGRHERGFIMDPLIDPPDIGKAISVYLQNLPPQSPLGATGEPWRAEISLLIQDLTWSDIGGRRYARKGLGEDGLKKIVNHLEQLAAARPGADRAGTLIDQCADIVLSRIAGLSGQDELLRAIARDIRALKESR